MRVIKSDAPATVASGPAAFGPGGPAESMPPGVALDTLVERAVRDDLAELPDDEVLGVIAAARRLRRRAEWLELRATLTDATMYTRPWTIGFTIHRDPDPNYELLELACWEGEQDLVHYPEDQGAPKKK